MALDSMSPSGMPLSTNLDDSEAVPYFLWDEPMTLGELRRRLAEASLPERRRLQAKILREARDTEVWRFILPRELRDGWPALAPLLGRRRTFWEFMLHEWERQGLLST